MTSSPSPSQGTIMNNNAPFIALINRVMRLHAPTHDQTSCSECGQSWPCKTVASIRHANDEGGNLFNDEPTALDLGFALRQIDTTFSSQGTKGERLVSSIHDLVLQPELEITGALYPETEFQASLKLNKNRALLLWKLVLSQQPVVHVHAALESHEGRHFLSGLLTDSFAPLETQQLIEWWRGMDGASSRSVIFNLPHRPSAAIAILRTLCNATMQLVESAVPAASFDSFELL